MTVFNIIILIANAFLMYRGLIFILLSKNKLKGRTIKPENKKHYFIMGIIQFSISLLIFLFYLIIVCG